MPDSMIGSENSTFGQKEPVISMVRCACDFKHKRLLRIKTQKEKTYTAYYSTDSAKVKRSLDNCKKYEKQKNAPRRQ